MTTQNNDKCIKIIKLFNCEICQYTTNVKCNYLKHLLSSKHLKTTNNNDKVSISIKKQYKCMICDKSYNDRAGLWRHNKMCNTINVTTTIAKSNEPSDKELIMILLNENKEFKNMIMKVIENGTHNTTNTNTNSHNKTFNLQVFLNETCKDAMNMSEFLNQLQLTIKDLDITGQDGFAVGIGIGSVMCAIFNNLHYHIFKFFVLI